MEARIMEAQTDGEIDDEVDGTESDKKDGKDLKKWDVPPGGVITNGAGYLTRDRRNTYHHEWSSVRVGPKSAGQLGKDLIERDHLILLMAERARTITTEQVARVFFNSHITARKRVRLLRERRFLVTPEADHGIVSAAVGHRGGTHNAPLVLDWNGKYLLEDQGYELRTWDPATVAQVNSRFGHTLAVSEVWSYVAAAARATHGISTGASNGAGAGAGSALNGRDVRNVCDVRDRLAVGLVSERDSVVYDGGCTAWSLHLENAQAQTADTGTRNRVRKVRDWKPMPLVKPDATLVLSITDGNATNNTSPFRYQGDWRKAMLPTLQSPADMRASEQLGHTRFRHIFLEMETGSNSSRDMVDKIGRYNRLYKLLREGDMMYGQSWRTLFGPTLPVILVAVRDSSQVQTQVTLWLRHFTHGAPGTVILADLEVLAQVYDMGRSHLLRQSCWLDVMRSNGAKWRPLGEILGLRV
jgi:hypothetical protein